MRIVNVMIVVLLLIMCNVEFASSLEIVEPKDKQAFEYGSKIRFVLRPETGENWIGVRIGLGIIPYDDNIGAYVGEYEFSDDLKPGELELVVTAVSDDNQMVEFKRTIIISVSSDVALQSIVIDPDPVILYKMPPDSDPNKIRFFESKRLMVIGVYSDGARRELSAPTSGTTYTSHNENIAVVSLEGKITALDIGNTIISVDNSTFRRDVQVIIKHYKPL